MDKSNNKRKQLKIKAMYNNRQPNKTRMNISNTMSGESIEHKLRRITQNKEPITDGAPIVYTERKDGVLPEYDIRTDRFEIAVEAMDKVTKSHKAKREARHETEEQKIARLAKEGMKKEGDGETKPVDGTQPKS